MRGIENELELMKELQELRELKKRLLEAAGPKGRASIHVAVVGNHILLLQPSTRVLQAIASVRRLRRSGAVHQSTPASSTIFDGSHSTVPGHLTKLNWSDLAR